MTNKYNEDDVLQLSYEIIQLIEQNISCFNDDETEIRVDEDGSDGGDGGDLDG